MIENGFIKLYRSLLTWEWYDDINTKTLFIHLLLTANYEDKQWHGITIKRGQRIYSREKLAKECSLSVQSLRTALKRLESTNELTNLTTQEYGLITVKNYEKFQQVTSESTNDQPAINQQLTSDQPQPKKAKKARKQDVVPPIAPQGADPANENEAQNSDKYLQAESLTVETARAAERLKNSQSVEHSTTLASRFEAFWSAYPKRNGKGAAEKAFFRIKPDNALLETMLKAIDAAKTSRQWREDDGKFIPNPSTWLNQKRWEDEQMKADKAPPKAAGGHDMYSSIDMDELQHFVTFGRAKGGT